MLGFEGVGDLGKHLVTVVLETGCGACVERDQDGGVVLLPVRRVVRQSECPPLSYSANL